MAGKHDKIKDSERFSIITPILNKCYICGSQDGIALHEVFFGSANRKKSKEEGLIVPLCCMHHNGSSAGVHFNKELDLKLKKQAEKIWLIKNNAQIKDFINIFGKNYLEEDEWK